MKLLSDIDDTLKCSGGRLRRQRRVHVSVGVRCSARCVDRTTISWLRRSGSDCKQVRLQRRRLLGDPCSATTQVFWGTPSRRSAPGISTPFWSSRVVDDLPATRPLQTPCAFYSHPCRGAFPQASCFCWPCFCCADSHRKDFGQIPENLDFPPTCGFWPELCRVFTARRPDGTGV